jgi:uncharacterized protein with PIN domain
MDQAHFRFYAELNDFLPGEHRQVAIPYRLNGPVAVKHPIEAFGIPHTEVDLILANGLPVNFSYMVEKGDLISVYPVFSGIEDLPTIQLRPELTLPPRFIIDGHLGQLATHLRLLGFDALYRSDFDDLELAQMAGDEERVLLTRDRRLLMRKVVVHGYWLRSKEPPEQVHEVLRRFQLRGMVNPWRRCLRCNGLLRPAPKEEVYDRLEPKTKKYYDEFHICQECEQIYWKGSHFEPLRRFVEEIMQERRSLPEDNMT